MQRHPSKFNGRPEHAGALRSDRRIGRKRPYDVVQFSLRIESLGKLIRVELRNHPYQFGNRPVIKRLTSPNRCSQVRNGSDFKVGVVQNAGRKRARRPVDFDEARKQIINLPALDIAQPGLTPEGLCRMPKRTQERFTVAGKSTKIRLDLRKIVSAVQQIRRQLHTGESFNGDRVQGRSPKCLPNQVKRGPTARLNSVQGVKVSGNFNPVFMQ